MRNISFALTTAQIRDRSKTVTRRLGWKTLTPGTLLQPVVKAQGLKRGERVEKIGGPIRVVSVRQELLSDIRDRYDHPREELAAEGFPEMSPDEFIVMFERHNGPTALVQRIEFEYVAEERQEQAAMAASEAAAWAVGEFMKATRLGKR